MDVGLHHRGVHTQPASANDALLARYSHHSRVDLLDDLGAERDGELAQSLGIGNLLRPYPSELPIHQVRAHLALEHAVAPVTHVLQEQQPQHHLSGRAGPPARAALRPTPRERLVDNLHELAIGEHSIDLAHPLFPQGTYFLLDQALGEG